MCRITRFRSRLLENLANLYLRLNRRFLNDGALHNGIFLLRASLKGEIDIIAVRFPYHLQSDRAFLSSSYLEINQLDIDIIIAEVKQTIRYV